MQKVEKLPHTKKGETWWWPRNRRVETCCPILTDIKEHQKQLCFDWNKTKYLKSLCVLLLDFGFFVYFRRLRKIAKRDYQLRHFCPSVYPYIIAIYSSAVMWRIFVKFDIWVYFENLCRKFKFHWNRRRIAGTLHEDQYTFVISGSVFLRMRNFSDKSCTENQNTHFVFNNFFFPENHAVYEIMWKNVVERGRPQMTVRRMHISH